MASIRLRPDQIMRLRGSDNAASVIRYAIKRWKRGDFVIGSEPEQKKGGEQLQVFPIWRKIEGLENWQIREILDKSWNTPDVIRLQELAMLTRQVEEMMKLLPPYVVTSQTEL